MGNKSKSITAIASSETKILIKLPYHLKFSNFFLNQHEYVENQQKKNK